MIALTGKSVDHQIQIHPERAWTCVINSMATHPTDMSVGVINWSLLMSVQSFMAIFTIVVEMCQSGPT